MDNAYARLGLPSRSALIRQAVLVRLEEIETMRIIEVRDMSEAKAMRLIDQHLKKHPGIHYTSDLADELGIDLPVAFAAAQKLIEKGRAKVGRN
jgi:DNA-binding MarR family transcriptional regulator